MTMQLICAQCQATFTPASFAWRCPCGGVLDIAPYAVALPWEKIRSRPTTLWRYREALPFAPDEDQWQSITLGEGMTPLIPAGSLAPDVFLKLEYLMPTLSFKDRGAAVLVTQAKMLGATHLIADSSGNAGTAIAAYAARAGISCDVYVPASASAKKQQQIALHGAQVHPVDGSREEVAAAAIAAVEETHAYYASHVYNPFFMQGTKTYAFEIWEQLDGTAPEVLILPVGNGTLLLGAYYGFCDLRDLGLIRTLPRIIGIQAANCAPLAQAFAAGQTEPVPVAPRATSAEGIAIAAPARGAQILAAVRDTGGCILAIDEAAIMPARQELAAQGLFVEPTAAITWAGYQAAVPLLYPDTGMPTMRIVIPLSGTGLKAG